MRAEANMILNRNVFWKIRELIENEYSWTYETDYDVMMAYPSTAGAVVIYPTFVINTNVTEGVAYEIGSRDRYNFYTEVVVFSNGIAQRDSVTFYLLDNLYNRDYTLYDISTTDPTAVGDYSNLNSLGQFRCGKAYSTNDIVPVQVSDRKMRFESDINVDIECPQFA